MEKSRKTAATIAHVALMAVLCVLCAVSAVMIFTRSSADETQKLITVLYGVMHVVIALALVCGIVYFLKGSGKPAAVWYKTMILLVALAVAIRLAGTLIRPGFGVAACMMIAILLALLVLRFVRNLGRTKTWIVFFILLALEVALAIITFDRNELMSSIAGSLARIILDCTIGIAIFEKYADKARRNTK